MLDKRNIGKTLFIFLALIFLIRPTQANAWERHHHDGHHFDHDFDHRYDYHYGYHHGYPHFGLRVSFLPDWYFSVVVGGSRYYYCDGTYYRRINSDYVVVVPPVGAVVRTIPPDYQTIVVNGVVYYLIDGTYYVSTSRGYQVVPQPVTVVQPSPVIVTQATPTLPTQVTVTAANPNAEESYTLNIPNSKGGYTAVTIKRSANGFIGPQGEFYSDFPKVEQLKVMYGA